MKINLIMKIILKIFGYYWNDNNKRHPPKYTTLLILDINKNILNVGRLKDNTKNPILFMDWQNYDTGIINFNPTHWMKIPFLKKNKD